MTDYTVKRMVDLATHETPKAELERRLSWFSINDDLKLCDCNGDVLRRSTETERLLWNLCLTLISERNTLREWLHKDQTGLVESLNQIVKTVEGYSWVTEGRGPYAWNDDRYKAEMLTMIQSIKELCTKGLLESRDRMNAGLDGKPPEEKRGEPGDTIGQAIEKSNL